MAQIHTFEFMQAEVNDLKAEIERLTKWNHDRLEELKERDMEIERLRAALKELLSSHDNLYITHFGPGSDPKIDIAAKVARNIIEQLTEEEPDDTVCKLD